MRLAKHVFGRWPVTSGAAVAVLLQQLRLKAFAGAAGHCCRVRVEVLLLLVMLKLLLLLLLLLLSSCSWQGDVCAPPLRSLVTHLW
jgi:hypothetical protein